MFFMFNYKFKFKNNIILILSWFLLAFLFNKTDGCQSSSMLEYLIGINVLSNIIIGFISYIFGFEILNIENICINFVLYVIFCIFWYILLFYLDGDFKNNFVLFSLVLFLLSVVFLPIYFKIFKQINLFFVYFSLLYSINFLATFIYIIMYGFAHDC